MLMSVFGVEIERHILPLLVQLGTCRSRQALRQRGLVIKLMGELMSCNHCASMCAGCAAQTGIESQHGLSGLLAGVVCKVEQSALGL